MAERRPPGTRPAVRGGAGAGSGSPRGGGLRIAVCGDSHPTPTVAAAAEAVGRGLAQRGAVMLCGGLGGVMAAAARGVQAAGGYCVGLLPGEDDRGAAPGLTLALPTGLGEGRDLVLVRAAHAVIAVGGGYGTLAEVALALKLGRPVVGLHTWRFQQLPSGPVDAGVARAETPEEAVRMALRLASSSRG